MNFNELYKILVEDVMTFEDKKKDFLTRVIKRIVHPGIYNQTTVAYSLFKHIFKFDPNRYKDTFIMNFGYELIYPLHKWFSKQQITDIEKIAAVVHLTRFLSMGERLDIKSLFNKIYVEFGDETNEKKLKVMNIIFDVVCTRAVKKGHKDMEKLLYRKSLNLDKETDQAWGSILDNL